MAWSGLKWPEVSQSGLEWVGAHFDKVKVVTIKKRIYQR